MINIGKHIINTWAQKQARVANNVLESEAYAILKGATEGLGTVTLFEDIGMDALKLWLHMDASAAMGIIERKGIGELIHVEVDVLWLQQQQARELLPITKIDGKKNMSNMMSKKNACQKMAIHFEMMNMNFKDGRAGIAQQLHSTARRRRRAPRLAGLTMSDVS